jgi:TetR/AcrR family transcriptional regulator, transcriptional repressor for nem operon
MVQKRTLETRQKLIQAATLLIRKKGYMATSVDDICAESGVTKGAFFHHYKTKEELAEACLDAWDQMAASMESGAPFQKVADPRKKVLAYMEFFTAIFDNPNLIKSCLAGTTAQEVSGTHPPLRKAAHSCFANAERRFQALLDEAIPKKPVRKRVDTASLAALWVATIQGSLILAKASGDSAVIRRNLEHVSQYITNSLPSAGVFPRKAARNRSTQP